MNGYTPAEDAEKIKAEIGESIKTLLSFDIPSTTAFDAFVSPENVNADAMNLNEADLLTLKKELYAIRKIIAFMRKEAENGYEYV